MSETTAAALQAALELREVEFCPSVSTQGYEELIKRSADLLSEMAFSLLAQETE